MHPSQATSDNTVQLECNVHRGCRGLVTHVEGSRPDFGESGICVLPEALDCASLASSAAAVRHTSKSAPALRGPCQGFSIAKASSGTDRTCCSREDVGEEG